MFALNFLGAVVYLTPTVRAGDAGITIDSGSMVQAQPFSLIQTTIWGVPADPANDAWRWAPVGSQGLYQRPASSQSPRRAFMSLPTSCSGEPLETTGRLDGWFSKGQFAIESFTSDPNDVPFVMTGCESLPFNPSVNIETTTRQTDAPSGLSFTLNVPQSDSPDGLATAHVRNVSVTLPEGVSISPAAASGLDACTDAQLAIGSNEPERCPNASKIGTAEVDTPLLDEPLKGSVYLGSQLSDDPASGDMYRMFIVIAGSGVRIKLEGKVKVDPATGQMTTVFEDNPQQPFSSLQVDFFRGSRAVLSTPSTCGEGKAEVDLVAWSGKQVSLETPLRFDCDPAGGGFNPGFAAGVTDPLALASPTFALRLTRQDREQELASLKSIELPEGLLGNVGKVELCGAAQADNGTCGEDSRIGRVLVAAGAGSTPLWVPQAGKNPTAVYLTGPYKGAPYGLSVVIPAQAGPYDLGHVVVRNPLHVDSVTTQLTAEVAESRVYNRDGSLAEVINGEIPSAIKGIPLRVREIRMLVDRENFLVNPTNCSQQQISLQAVSVKGRTAQLADRFRAAECAKLGFAPRFRAQILNKGRKSTLRSFHPRTRFAVVPRQGDANIGGARVVLPSSTILDQANIGTTCTRDQMAAENCPEASVVGYAKAWSPLLRKAVEGPVYLAANGGVRPLPDLAAVMDGEIRVVLQGEISTRRGGGKARLQNTFRVVPDAPVSRFVLTMRGGAKRGLLVNSTDLCRTNERGAAVFFGQNGRRHRLRPRIATAFKGCGKVRRQIAKRRAAARRAG